MRNENWAEDYAHSRARFANTYQGSMWPTRKRHRKLTDTEWFFVLLFGVIVLLYSLGVFG